MNNTNFSPRWDSRVMLRGLRRTRGKTVEQRASNIDGKKSLKRDEYFLSPISLMRLFFEDLSDKMQKSVTVGRTHTCKHTHIHTLKQTSASTNVLITLLVDQVSSLPWTTTQGNSSHPPVQYSSLHRHVLPYPSTSLPPNSCDPRPRQSSIKHLKYSP